MDYLSTIAYNHSHIVDTQRSEASHQPAPDPNDTQSAKKLSSLLFVEQLFTECSQLVGVSQRTFGVILRGNTSWIPAGEPFQPEPLRSDRLRQQIPLPWRVH